MKLRILFLFLALCLVGFSDISAQNNRAERAKKRAENRANQKVDNKINQQVDNAVDDAFNAIGGLFKKKKRKKKGKKTENNTDNNNTDENADVIEADENAAASLSALFGEKWEPYTNPKKFSAEWNIVTTKRNGKKESANIQFSVVETQSGYAADNPEKPDEKVRMILETQTGKMVMISTEKGETTGTRMRMPNLQAMIRKEMEKQQEENRWTIDRTGERMTIDGYSCEKYVITDTKTGDVTDSWITTEAGLSWMEMSSGVMGAFSGAQMQNPMGSVGGDFLNGLVIKSVTVSKKETTELHITNIKTGSNTDTSILDVSGIEITELRF